MNFSRFTDSPSLTLALAIVAPPVFIWSRNWHMFNWKSLGISFCVLLAAAILVFAVVWFLDALYLRKKEYLPVWIRRVIGFSVCAAVVGIICFLLYVPFSDFPQAYRRGIRISGLTLAAVIVFFAGFRPLNFFLALCLLLFFGSGAVDVFQFYNSQRNAISANSADENAANAIDAVNASPPVLTFKAKPNIYLFWLESYHSLPIMREVYGIDTEPLHDYLKNRQFFIYDNVYSNSAWTLPSMTDLYTMTPQFASERGNFDIGPEGRGAIGGNEANAVYKVLKDNGYYTTYITLGSPYYFHTKGIYLDDTDLYGVHKLGYFQPLLELNNKLQSSGDRLFLTLSLAIDEGMQRNQPFYIGFKDGATHTPTRGYTWENKEDWVTGGRYQEVVKKSNQRLVKIVDHIIVADPQSIIILLGDHGSHRLLGIDSGVGELSELEAILQKNGESMDSLAKDYFGVLMAIRMPGGVRDISQGYPMSHVNLFRHIFAALSDDMAILKERQPAWSRFRNFVLVKEGIVQHTSVAEPTAP